MMYAVRFQMPTVPTSVSMATRRSDSEVDERKGEGKPQLGDRKAVMPVALCDLSQCPLLAAYMDWVGTTLLLPLAFSSLAAWKSASSLVLVVGLASKNQRWTIAVLVLEVGPAWRSQRWTISVVMALGRLAWSLARCRATLRSGCSAKDSFVGRCCFQL